MTEDDSPHFDALMPPPYLRAYPTKISKKKVLETIMQSQNIILSKDLTEKQTTILLENCAALISFVQKDNYAESWVSRMGIERVER